jgi:hypothetical protein
VVVTAYDLIHAKLAEYFPPDDPTVGQQRAAFARADLVLAISQCTADDLQEVLGVPTGKIAVTHLGVSTPPARAVTTTGRSKPFLLYVGLRYGYKNWESFVRAVAACRQSTSSTSSAWVRGRSPRPRPRCWPSSR